MARPLSMNPNARIIFSLPPELIRQVRNIAEAENVNVSAIATRLLRYGLKAMEVAQ